MNKFSKDGEYERFVKSMPYLLPFIALVISVALGFSALTNGIKIEIICNGQSLGAVSDVAEYEKVKAKVEKRMSDYLGLEYKFEGDVKFKTSFGSPVQKVSDEELYNEMYAVSSKGLTEAYALYIDKTLVAASDSMAVLENAIKKTEKLVSTQLGSSVEIANPTFFAYRPVSNNCIMTEGEIVSLLCSVTSLDSETIKDYENSVAVFNAKKYLSNKLPEKTGCNLSNTYYTPVDFTSSGLTELLFKSTKIETYTEAVAFKTVYEDSDKYYEGLTYVKQQGVLGTRNVTANVSYVDGEETEREILSEEIITEPTDKIVYVGTKPKPPTAPTGVFIAPLDDFVLSCEYGFRRIFGGTSFHYGIDLYVPMGTTVYASDGGRVVKAEYSGAYGLVVKLDHGGKYQTIYAHLSRLLVRAGDEVYQGQPIGESGMSGRVTGPHLHFEIFEFEQRKDPLLYMTSLRPKDILSLTGDDLHTALASAMLYKIKH